MTNISLRSCTWETSDKLILFSARYNFHMCIFPSPYVFFSIVLWYSTYHEEEARRKFYALVDICTSIKDWRRDVLAYVQHTLGKFYEQRTALSPNVCPLIMIWPKFYICNLCWKYWVLLKIFTSLRQMKDLIKMTHSLSLLHSYFNFCCEGKQFRIYILSYHFIP
jgi:hypothetical protein